MKSFRWNPNIYVGYSEIDGQLLTGNNCPRSTPMVDFILHDPIPTVEYSLGL